MARPPLILLPPSEGKAIGGDGPSWSPGSDEFPELDAQRQALIGALAVAMKRNEATRAKLLGVKGAALAAATATNIDIATAPTLPAIERYTGVLYDALDHGSMGRTATRRAAAQVITFSGLWGLVTPTTPIPDYKLKMGATLGRIGKLSTRWKPVLTEAIAPFVEGRTVWDLLPNEHAAAWSPRNTGLARRISVRFLDDLGSGRNRRVITVSHWNKLLKGALVRHLLATQLADPDGLTEFHHPQGYRYRPDLTERRDDLTVVSLVARR